MAALLEWSNRSRSHPLVDISLSQRYEVPAPLNMDPNGSQHILGVNPSLLEDHDKDGELYAMERGICGLISSVPLRSFKLCDRSPIVILLHEKRNKVSTVHTIRTQYKDNEQKRGESSR